MSNSLGFSQFKFYRTVKSLNLMIAITSLLVSGCASDIALQNKSLDTPKETPETLKSKDRLDLGVGYEAMRGANIYGNYKGFFDSSIVEANTKLALSDKYLDAKQLFAIPNHPAFAVGYSASFRDFKIVPSDSSTKNRQISLNAIGTMVLSNTSNLVSTFGVEKINSKSGMAGNSGSQLLFPATITYRNDERVHPQFPTEGFGHFFKANLEVSPFGQQYIKGSIRGQLDIPLTQIGEKFALSFKFFAGSEKSLGNNPVPVIKRFFLENGSPVRGYAANGFGYNSVGLPIGGNTMITASAELWTPLFHKDLRAYTFFDSGFMQGNGISTSDLKTSAGVGIAWASPVGIISVSYGQALEKNPVNTQIIGIGLGINY